MQVKGEFSVNMAPQEDDINVGRMNLDKEYSGDLNGIGVGQILSMRTAMEGSAGYVAIEHFSGTLAGRKGCFSLQHSGLMNRGQPNLSVTVIPDSGTDELTGLTGTMDIEIKDGKHFYSFEYDLGELE